jgi:hypothetical protein
MPAARLTRSGNTSTFATTSGSLPNGHCVSFDVSGNLVDSGGACAGGPGVTSVNALTGAIVGVDTSTINPQSSSHPIVAADCGTFIYMTGGLNTATLPTTSGFPAACTITVKDAETYPGGRAKILSGFPSDLNPILWPQQSATVKIGSGGNWVTSYNPGLWIPTSAVTFHVNSTAPGSDTNNDCLGTGTGACATANHAMTLISQGIVNNPGISIQWDTNTTANFIALPYAGPGTITLNGNSQLINVSSAPGSILLIGQPTAPVYGNWIIENFSLQSNTTAGIYGIQCLYGAHCTLGGGMLFVNSTGGGFSAGGAIQAGFGSNLICSTGFTVQGNFASVLEADDFGRIDCNGQTITLVSTPFFSAATVVAHGAGAIVSIPSVTWPGPVTSGTKKYNANLLALIDSGACNSIPGTVAGTPTAGTLGTDGAFCN